MAVSQQTESLASVGKARNRALLLVSASTVFGLSVWFSTNAIAPALEAEKGFSAADIAWLTVAVQLGFVAGTLMFADRPRDYFPGVAKN